MILTTSNMNQLANRCIAFAINSDVYVLVESDRSFFFSNIFRPHDHKYKGKKREVVIAAAMRDHEVHAVESTNELRQIV